MKLSLSNGLKLLSNKIALLSTSAFLLSSSLPVLGANIPIDFREFKTESENQFYTSEEIYDFLANQQSTAGMISAIPYCEGVYGFPNGLGQYPRYGTTEGAIYVKSTDKESGEDVGGISFTIAPKYRHRNSSINIYAYEDENIDSSEDLDIRLELSINNGDYFPTTISKTNGYSLTLNAKPDGEIIKELSCKLPNPYRLKDNSLKEVYEDYYIALTRILLVYNDATDNPQSVTKWEFERGEDETFINNDEEYELPKLSTEPEEAADMAEYTSSDPDVAEIKNGKITIKKAGTTTISASLPENPLFLESDSYAPASYLLTVKYSQQTGIDQISSNRDSEFTIYDLNGNIISSPSIPGIYIKKSSSRVEKIVIR